MPKSVGITVENNFKNGLISEATGFNFPEHACTDTQNCIFSFDGSVQRRIGIDFESDYSTKTINRTGSVVCSYIWKNVNSDGTVNLLVLQVGDTIYFYETEEDSISNGAVGSNISLATYNVIGAPGPATVEAQFSSGNGKLFITHPYCEPIMVTYDVSSQTPIGTALALQIRDFVGDTTDPYGVDTRPLSALTSVGAPHYYNLLNQGWTVDNLTIWDGMLTSLPSNADVMWLFHNATENFDLVSGPGSSVRDTGNSPAPKGHFVLPLFSQNRDTASGLSGTLRGYSGTARPRTAAFHAGRAFFAGIPASGLNSTIYYSQIALDDSQFSKCYQRNDPTSEHLFDLLPNDGGFVTIHDAGSIYKLVSIPGMLLVFAENGVWSITGSSGVGFSATDYTVSKISTVSTISASSFVDVGGNPCWWNLEGIFIVTLDGGAPTVKSMTLTSIQSFYDAIPASCKYTARGYFNLATKIIQWVYHDEDTSDPEDTYTFNHILNFDTRTSAFYPWTVDDSVVSINSIVVLSGAAGETSLDNVIDDSSDQVQDDSFNDVIAFSSALQTASPIFLYIVSYPSGSSYEFTIAGAVDLDYRDWFSYDTIGVDYSSYFISGYRLRGQGITKWQTNWIELISRTDAPVTYQLQGCWDYSVSAATKRWSTAETVTHLNLNYSYAKTRRKLRGEGLVLQIKINSITGKPFDIVGWTTFDTANQVP